MSSCGLMVGVVETTGSQDYQKSRVNISESRDRVPEAWSAAHLDAPCHRLGKCLIYQNANRAVTNWLCNIDKLNMLPQARRNIHARHSHLQFH